MIALRFGTRALGTYTKNALRNKLTCLQKSWERSEQYESFVSFFCLWRKKLTKLVKLVKLMKSGVRHTPVLLKEVIEGLALREGDIVVDATFGDGGHAREICKKIGTSGALIGLDLDEEAIQQGGAITKECAARIFLEKENFKNMDRVISLRA